MANKKKKPTTKKVARKKAARTEQTRKASVVLSGGAPNSPLMAGALCAIHDEGKTFDLFYTSGAGAMIGALYLAPKGKSTRDAMRDVVEAGISDAIWDNFPMPFKAFYKSGPFTRPMQLWGEHFKLPLDEKNEERNFFRRFYNDAVSFWVATMTPTDLSFRSTGVCCPFPFLEEVIDFEKFKELDVGFYMNAYNISEARMEVFEKALGEITPRHFHAALAFPFVYPPCDIGGKLYFEGSAYDPLNLKPEEPAEGEPPPRRNKCLATAMEEVDTVVIMDILGSLKRSLIRRPRNIFDAYGISIITPIVSLAEKNLREFKDTHAKRRGKKRRVHMRMAGTLDLPRSQDAEYHEIRFEIPPEHRPYVLDWSHSNLERLWHIGYASGKDFVVEHGERLPDAPPKETAKQVFP